MEEVKYIECPRDAMQGIKTFIPTEEKIRYLNQLLKVGFHTLDFGSFVSHKAIPQLADTVDVVKELDLSSSPTKLLAIIANERGANDACLHESIAYLGFPFSASQTFQQRNTNASQNQALDRIQNISEIAKKHKKALVVYLSMGFGNPYEDEYSTSIALNWVNELITRGVSKIILSDTIGVSNSENISVLFNQLIPEFPETEFGCHFHSTVESRVEKLNAAWQAGCRSFDSAINGVGGCPLSGYELVGNMSTESVQDFISKTPEVNTNWNEEAYEKAKEMAKSLFNTYH